MPDAQEHRYAEVQQLKNPNPSSTAPAVAFLAFLLFLSPSGWLKTLIDEAHHSSTCFQTWCVSM